MRPTNDTPTKKQTLGIAVVIAAAALATAANTDALDSVLANDTQTSAGTSTSTDSATVNGAAARIGADDLNVVIDTSTEPSAAAATSSPPSQVAAAAQNPATTYQIGEAGSITVDYVDGDLRVTELSPASGWTAAAPDDGEPSAVYAVFSDATVLVELRATYADGVLTPSLHTIEVAS